MGERTRKIGIRLVFVMIAVLLPIELVVSRIYGEPYPALFQPSFGLGAFHSGGFSDTEMTVIIKTEHGTLHVPFSRFKPATRVDVTQPLTEHLQKASTDVEDEATRDWFFQRAKELYPQRAAHSIQLVWYDVNYSFTGPRSEKVVKRSGVMTQESAAS